MAIDRVREAALWSEAGEILADLQSRYLPEAKSFRPLRKIAAADPQWPRWIAIRAELCELYQSIVWSIAGGITPKLPKLSTTCLDEVASMAQIGLLNALDGFDQTANVRFTSFCGQRIKGAILDELRKLDHISRRVRERARQTGEELPQMHTQSEVPDSTEMDPTDDEFAKRTQAVRDNPDLVLRYFGSRLRPIARMLIVDQMSVADVRRRCLCPPEIFRKRMRAFWLRLEEVAGPMEKRTRSSFIEVCCGLAQEDSLC